MKSRVSKEQARRKKLKHPGILYVKVNDGFFGSDDFVGAKGINKLFETSSLGKTIKIGIYELVKIVDASGVIETKESE